MFESLKSKMKSLFSKAKDDLDEKEIFKDETEQTTTPKTPIQDSQPEPEQPKLSRKEMLKLQKQERASGKDTHKSASVVSESGGKKIKDSALDEILDELYFTLLEADVALPVADKIKDSALDEILDELYFTLLEADVALPVADKIKEGVRANLTGKKYDRSYSLEEVVEMSVKDAVRDVLELNEFNFDQWVEEEQRPTVIMFVGINGTGKTTAIAKIANRLQKSGKSVIMAACDTFRAGHRAAQHPCRQARMQDRQADSGRGPRCSGLRRSGACEG